MPVLLLLHRLILRPLFSQPLRTVLTLLIVALGVSVVVAIDLSGNAAAGSFHSSLESLAGSADLELSATGGVDERLLGKLASLPYDLRFDPRMEDYALEESSGKTIAVIGVDLVARALLDYAVRDGASVDLSEGNPIWVSPSLRSLKGKSISLTLNDKTEQFVVRGVLPDSRVSLGDEDLIVMDIGLAQRVMAREGRVDRIEARVPHDRPLEEWQRIIKAEAPQADVRPQGARTDENRKMLAAFRWNLRVLSCISLVVGAFLIYNTISISVVRRRNEIGIVRALGATRGAVLAAFLLEAGFFGLAGALLGLPLGRLLAEVTLQLISATVESLYVSSQPGPIEFTLFSAVTALILGVGMAVFSALAPALEAADVSPTEAMARGREQYATRMSVGRNLIWAAALCGAGALAAQLPPIGGKPLWGYLAAGLLVFGSAMAAPALVLLIASAVRPLLWRVEAKLAAQSLVASLRRTAVLVGALSTAIAMVASVGIMVGSFRQTVVVWMDNQLKADFFLRPAGPPAADRHPTIDLDLTNDIERIPEVAQVDRFRIYDISYEGLPVSLGGGDSDAAKTSGRTVFLSGDKQRILTDLPKGDNVIVSEPFANKHHVRTGDVLALPLGGQVHPFHILGVYYDYSSERGYIVMDRKTMLKYLPDPNPSNIAVYLKPGVDVEAARKHVERVSSRRKVLLFTNRSLRREAIRIFDRTFAITYALEAIAVFVAVMGVAGALLALVIDRRRELALLRFLGASASQIRGLILCEAGLLGLASNAAGMLLGGALSLVLIFVINKQSFGWTIQFHWPVAVLLSALSVVYAATILAGIYPARAAVRLNPIEAVHEE